MDNTVTCSKCLAYRPDENAKGWGICFRLPPMALSVPTRVMIGGSSKSQVASAWPPVPESGMCLMFIPNAENREKMEKAKANLQ